MGRAVALDRHRAQHLLGLEARVGADLNRPRDGVYVALVGLDDPHVPCLAAGRSPQPLVHVLDHELAEIALGFPGRRGHRVGPMPRAHGHGEQGRKLRVAVDQLPAAISVQQVDRVTAGVGLPAGERIGDEEVPLAERQRAVVPAARRLLVGRLDEAHGRDPLEPLGHVAAQARVHDAQRPRPGVVVGRADADQLASAGDLPGRRIVQRVGVLAAQVAAVDHPRVRAVGADRPQHLDRRPEPHHVFPAGEADRAVVQQERVPLAVLAHRDLAHVAAVRVHREDAVGQRPVAALHQPARPVRHEGDPSVGQVKRIAVLKGARSESSRRRRPAVGAHLPDLKLVARSHFVVGVERRGLLGDISAAHAARLGLLTLGSEAEHDPAAVEREVRPAERALRKLAVGDAPDLGPAVGPDAFEDADPAAGQGKRAQTPGALVHGVRVVPAHEEQPGALQERVLEGQAAHRPVGVEIDPQPGLRIEPLGGQQPVAGGGRPGQLVRAGPEVFGFQLLQVGQDLPAPVQQLVDRRHDVLADLFGRVGPLVEARLAPQAVLAGPVLFDRAGGRPEARRVGQGPGVRGPDPHVADHRVGALDVDELQLQLLAVAEGRRRDVEEEPPRRRRRKRHVAVNGLPVGLQTLDAHGAGLRHVDDVHLVGRLGVQVLVPQQAELVVKDDVAVLGGRVDHAGRKDVLLAADHVRHGLEVAAVILGHQRVPRRRLTERTRQGRHDRQQDQPPHGYRDGSLHWPAPISRESFGIAAPSS